ncbi:ankyrin repeat domain-containing protein [Seonamhaeicola maritimus]|uniref:ankyrin repeat domain-containing protein n=1 Tax=Seonamhaeicola maritimus TaxID=2591822 RepID=UPI002495A1F7|nr:ankyrin repeat domain-containing protein [Seonamhaeicola maritimus]
MKKIFYLLFLVSPFISIWSQNEETTFQYPFGETGIEAPRGVYGTDDRKEVTDAYGIADFVRATAVMINKADIVGNKVYGYTLRERLQFRFKSSNFDKNIKFLDQPTSAMCTGFLIAPDILVTAGHCIKELKDAKDYVWVFDYTNELKYNNTFKYIEIDPNNVYEVTEVLDARLNNETVDDYSFLRLNRKSARAPYRFRTSGKVGYNTKVNTIGSPTGLPLKFAGNATVVDDSQTKWFKNSIDTFPGNSGGPVFSTYGFLEGIHVRGAVTQGHNGNYTGDYKYDENCDCIKTVEFSSAYWTAGAQAHRITQVPFTRLHQAIYENIEYAIINNNTERLKSWVAYSWILDHEYTKKRGRLEITAAKRNNLEALKYLISNSSKENIDIYGETLIKQAISNNNVSMLEYLLNQDIPFDARSYSASSYLLSAFKNSDYTMVDTMLNNGWSVNATDYRGNNLLHLAASKNNMSLIRKFADKGVSAVSKNRDGKRPEHIAKKNKNKVAQKYLKKIRKQQS